MATERLKFTTQLQDFTQAPTPTDYFSIRKHIKRKTILQLDIEAWLIRVQEAEILYYQSTKDITKEHIPWLLFLSIAKEFGSGSTLSVDESTKILETILSLFEHTKTEDKAETKSSTPLDKKNEVQLNFINNLKGFVYFLRGRIIDTSHLNEAIHYLELAQKHGYKEAYSTLGIIHCRQEKWDKALDYFHRAVQEGNYFEALKKIGVIYVKHGEHVTALTKYCTNTRIQLGVQKLREAHQKGISIKEEILELYTLFPKSIDLLYQAAIIVKDKKAITELKKYIKAKKENAADVFSMIERHNDNLQEVSKILFRWQTESKTVSSETILKEFQYRFATQKQAGIKALTECCGTRADAFVPFILEFKSSNPKLLFKRKLVPQTFSHDSVHSGNSDAIKKSNEILQKLEKEKQAFITTETKKVEVELKKLDPAKAEIEKKAIRETADAKYQGRIEKEQKIILTQESLIREQQLATLLLYVDDYTRETLDFALEKNIPPQFIELIIELSTLFYYYRNHYLTARDNEHNARREKFYSKYNNFQTLFQAAEELRTKTPCDRKEDKNAPSQKTACPPCS